MSLYGVTLIIGFVAAVVQICTDPRITRQYLRKATVAVVVYIAYGLIALPGLVVLIRHASGPHADATLFTAFLAWVGLGVLGLIRFTPRLQGQAPPQFLEHFGVLDVICLIVLMTCVGASLIGV